MNLIKLEENRWVNTIVELRKPLFVVAVLWGSSLATMLYSDLAQAELRCDCSQVIDSCSATVSLQDMNVAIDSDSDACSRVDYLIDGQPFAALVVGGSSQLNWSGQPLRDPSIVVENCRVCADSNTSQAGSGVGLNNADAAPVADRAAELIIKVMPDYPRDASANRLEGNVTVKFNVSVTGVVENIRVVDTSSQAFINNSIDAISRFRYAPAMQDGEAIATADMSEQFQFRVVDGIEPVVRSVAHSR